MATFDFDAFLDHTLFGLDILSMLEDIENFLEFSESNIAQQKQRELQRAEEEADEAQFTREDEHLASQYRDQMIQAVEYHFDISLSQRVRYSALSALVTTIDWCALSLERRTTFKIPKKPKQTNRAVHILRIIDDQAKFGIERYISEIECLVHVRNCVVHAAGLVDTYEYKADLNASLAMLKGLSVSSKNYLGDGIEIETGALESYLEAAKQWLPELEKHCLNMGLLK